MRIAVLGGAGAMGGVIGGRLAEGGNDVTLIDVARPAVDVINRDGLRLEDQAGNVRTIPIRATVEPSEVGPVDLLIVFVKCYHRDEAVRSAAPLLGPETVVLTLQNGWGNAARLAELVGAARVLAGVTYHSATLIGPGHVRHAAEGMTFIGELDGAMTERLRAIAEAFESSGLAVTPTGSVIKEIWSKLALNVCTLPTAALLRCYAGALLDHDGTLRLMRALLLETVAVAQAQDIPLDFDERWTAITGLLKRATTARASMLQDVENRRRTEIDVINGAIVAAGERLGIPTPYNQSLVWLARSLEETF
jgi:2-dehydropantoate 2-reductase